MTGTAPSGIGAMPEPMAQGLESGGPTMRERELYDYDSWGQAASEGHTTFSPTKESSIESNEIDLGGGNSIDSDTLVGLLSAGVENLNSPSAESEVDDWGSGSNSGIMDNLGSMLGNVPSFSPSQNSHIDSPTLRNSTSMASWMEPLAESRNSSSLASRIGMYDGMSENKEADMMGSYSWMRSDVIKPSVEVYSRTDSPSYSAGFNMGRDPLEDLAGSGMTDHLAPKDNSSSLNSLSEQIAQVTYNEDILGLGGRESASSASHLGITGSGGSLGTSWRYGMDDEESEPSGYGLNYQDSKNSFERFSNLTANLELTKMGNSIKIREEGRNPFMRIDREAHHGLPEDHLQYGKSLYTGRKGEEAYDIFAEVYRKTKINIKFPGIDED